jgi:hypothetical protein
MKKILNFFILTYLFFSCKSSNEIINYEPNSIIYIFPVAVENIISDYIPKNKNVFFDLHKINNHYIIYVIEKQDNLMFIINNSTRKVLINKKLIPLIFDYDSEFATLENTSEVISRIEKNKNNQEPYTRQKKFNPIYDNVLYVKFNKNGQIISQNINPKLLKQ